MCWGGQKRHCTAAENLEGNSGVDGGTGKRDQQDGRLGVGHPPLQSGQGATCAKWPLISSHSMLTLPKEESHLHQ
jgi:hypothetical protein